MSRQRLHPIESGGPRYQACDEHEHGCCYAAMVVDTVILTRYGYLPGLVCECPDIETAKLIALALNRNAGET